MYTPVFMLYVWHLNWKLQDNTSEGLQMEFNARTFWNTDIISGSGTQYCGRNSGTKPPPHELIRNHLLQNR
jgi:hypothetical protein